MNDKPQADSAAWVQRENLPFRIIHDPDRRIAAAYGIAQPNAERYVANNAEGRRPAVIIDEQGRVLLTLPDLKTVEEQQQALAKLF